MSDQVDSGQEIFETNSNKYLGCDVESSDYSGIQDFLVGDEILPLESNSLDLIISNSVLEHLKIPETAIAEWYRVLKPGGYLFLQTNFLYQEHCSPDDYFRFSIYGLRELLNRENLEIKLSKKSAKDLLFLNNYY
jgi:ubiquinone/menaquinone biosynthesis C-methylase UbiE